jgi:DNA-binding transcriptional ArsR family regulator
VEDVAVRFSAYVSVLLDVQAMTSGYGGSNRDIAKKDCASDGFFIDAQGLLSASAAKDFDVPSKSSTHGENSFSHPALTFDIQSVIFVRMSSNSGSASSGGSVNRRRMANFCSTFGSVPRWQIIDILRSSGGKNIKTLAKRLGLSHTAAGQHVKILRAAGVVEAVLVDQDDPRLTHQRLSEKNLVTDEEGKQWLDFGKVRICLD